MCSVARFFEGSSESQENVEEWSDRDSLEFEDPMDDVSNKDY